MIKENKVWNYLLYAIGEVILVVVGILIAVQIDNWNQHRNKVNEGDEYRERLISDLEADHRSITLRVIFFDQVNGLAEHADSLLRMEGKSSPEDQWDLIYSVFQASQIWPFRTTITTYNESQNNGALQYLASDSTLQKIAKYYIDSSEQLDILTGGTTAYRDYTRGIIPMSLQRYIWSECFKIQINENQLFITCGVPEGVDDIINDVYLRLRQSEVLPQILTRRLATLHIRSVILKNFLDENETLLNDLNQNNRAHE